jgi:hypothetical protein
VKTKLQKIVTWDVPEDNCAVPEKIDVLGETSPFVEVVPSGDEQTNGRKIVFKRNYLVQAY